MSQSLKRPFLRRLENYFFRPIFVLCVFLLVLVAITQLAGRLTMLVLPVFEDEISSLLAARNIQLRGLSGSWSGLNPVLRAESLQLPTGQARALLVELDYVESVLRGALVPRRAEANHVLLFADKTSQGWQLRGLTPNQELFDPTSILRHGDELKVNGHIVFTDADHSWRLHISATALNTGAHHYAVVEVSAGHQGESDKLVAQHWQQQAIPFVQEQTTIAALHGRLPLGGISSSMPQLQLELANGVWRDQAGVGGGEIEVTLANVLVPGTKTSIDISLSLAGLLQQARLSGHIPGVQIRSGADTLNLPSMYLSAQVENPQAMVLDLETFISPEEQRLPQARVWMKQLDLAAISAFVDEHLADWNPAGRWIAALALQGQINNLHAFVDSQYGFGFSASVANLVMQGYKGAPLLANVQGRLWGYQSAVTVQINASQVDLQFPGLFHQRWTLDSLQGVVKAWFEPGYFALRGSHLRGQVGPTAIAASFAISRPNVKNLQTVGLLLDLDEVGLIASKQYIPYKIPDGLAQWLETGPQAGELSNVKFAYYGQVHRQPGELARRIELLADVSNAKVVYDPRWPVVTELEGQVHAAGRQTRVRVDYAKTMGIKLHDANVVLHDNVAYAQVDLKSTLKGTDALQFVHSSPLIEQMAFVSPDWESSGELSIEAGIVVPFKKSGVPDLSVELRYQLDDFGLTMPEYRTAVSKLRGQGEFSLPHYLSGNYSGLMFGRDARFEVLSEKNWVRIDIAGTADTDDVYRMIASPDIGVAEGQFDFRGRMNIAVGENMITNLAVTTDLVDLAINLPGQFAKPALEPQQSQIDVQFLPRYQSVRWQYKDTNGWVHVGEDGIERGAIGVGSGPPMTNQNESALLISGTMPQVTLSDWISNEGDVAVNLPIDWVIQDLHIQQFNLDEMSFADIALKGHQRAGDIQFHFDGADLVGQVEYGDDGMFNIDLDFLRIPAAQGETEADPISLESGRSLTAFNMNIKQLELGDEPFGAWRFNVQPQGDVVRFSNLDVEVNGVRITDGDLSWNLADNRSAFKGVVELDDLAQTLPKWDYAPSVQTDQATITVDSSWPGSPANINLLGMRGDLSLVARNGRFTEVESSGGLKIMSLLNFSNIAKRISLDFSDVTADGIGFEKVDASIRLNRGKLSFLEPMIIDSRSSHFQVGGKVDLRSGELNNEMIVTLPVSNSLPWYGVYLALANPLAGLGVIIGERVFRKPIEAFSTAKFSVKGTLEHPKVNFVGLWDQSIDIPLVDETQEDETQEIETQPVDSELSLIESTSPTNGT